MTGRERERSSGREPTRPTDPGWEAELVAGLEAEGGSGSVEPELAIARLILHAGNVESLDDDAIARVWTEIDRGIAPVPWWRKRWFAIGGPALVAAAAAVIFVVVISPNDGRERSDTSASAAQKLEQQFELLAPAARAEVSRTVDAGRGKLRGELIAMAMRDADKTHGGAP